ncbi:MAG: UDP-N-acetyl-D-mannosamine dehydrogenase [Pseudomonadota bacterium]|nr:UDP-N-acetyl-D-mannosamine dehydrogenase [Pseudomonadota bacterium]
MKKTISVIGLGYIGLPTAAVFAASGVKVIGVDTNENVVNLINKGKIHIIEPGLEDVVKKAVKDKLLIAQSKPSHADAYLIAVPTPFHRDHEPDLSYIKTASKSIASVLKKGDLVILESTSPVGTTEQMSTWLAEARPDLTFPQSSGEDSDIRIAHCPERVLPGKVLNELVMNDRVIGGMTPRCSSAASSLYQIFLKGACIITNARTAEMCKLTENSYRDLNIAFANELSIICDKLNINVWELIQLANRHPRVNILQPGAGVGGHCIAVDPWFIVHKTPDESQIIRTARKVNDEKPQWIIKKIYSEIKKIESKGRPLNEINIAILGITFKPNIDDLRESPALEISRVLIKNLNLKIAIIEPNIKQLPDDLSNARLLNLEEGLSQADIIAVLVKHDQFENLSQLIKPHQKYIDAVGIFS